MNIKMPVSIEGALRELRRKRPRANSFFSERGRVLTVREAIEIIEKLQAQGEEYIYLDDGDTAEDDLEFKDLYDKAVELVKGYENITYSLLQRHLKISFNMAARLIEKMEQNSIVRHRSKVDL